MTKKFYRVFFSCLLLLVASSALASFGLTQRDHLTAEEIDRVKEAQALDKRTEVYVKAIERRLLALTDPKAASSKSAQKDSEKWGELRKGTRMELLSDIARIHEEAITNIEDVASRDEKSQLLSTALRKLSDASTRFASQLSTLRDQAQDARERAAIDDILEKAAEITSAAQKLPPPDKKEKNSKQ